MKKSILILVLSLILVISAWLVFDHISHSGSFTLESDSSASKALLDETNALYLGYGIKWEGTGTPTLERVEMIRRDGTIADTDLADSFIAETNAIGVLDGETVEKEGLAEELSGLGGFRAEHDFHLVIRVQGESDLAENDINELRITYKKFGITQYQDLALSEGVVTEEAVE